MWNLGGITVMGRKTVLLMRFLRRIDTTRNDMAGGSFSVFSFWMKEARLGWIVACRVAEGAENVLS